MSVKPFEDFLVEQLLGDGRGVFEAGFRYQFKSPAFANSIRLHHAMLAKANGSIDAGNGINIPYIISGDTKILPVLHSDDPKNPDGYSENYISHLRDEVSNQTGVLKGCALVVIHNSLLDTLINSADDLAGKDQVWSTSKIKISLEGLIDLQDKGKDVSFCLLDDQFAAISDDGATMFGFESLYNAVEDGDLRFNELGMFEDPLIAQMSGNQNQIKRRLEENRKLYQGLSFEVEHYPNMLKERLKFLGDKFIEEHFSETDAWKDVDFEAYVQEKKRNSQQKLVLEGEQTSDGSTFIARARSETKAGQRDRQVIILLDEGVNEFELKISFQGASNLDKKQFGIVPQKALNKQELISARNSFNGASATLRASYHQEPLFFTLALKRENKSESCNFRCLVLRNNEFYVDAFKNHFLVEPSKKRLTLNMEANKLQIGESVGDICQITDSGQTANVANCGWVDFENLANEADVINFSVKSGENSLCFNIEGAVATDSLNLPLLLNQGRFNKLFNDEYNGEFYSQKSKVSIDNSEFTVPGLRRDLLRWEEQCLKEEVVSLLNDDQISLEDLLDIHPSIFAAYQALFNYLQQKKTLPSLVSWGPEFLELAHNVVQSCLQFYAAIPTGEILTDAQKLSLKIGIVLDGEDEYYSPLHPLILAYYVNLTQQIINDESNSFGSLPKITLERLSPKGLLPYVFHPKHQYSINQHIKENFFWIKSVPQEQSSLSFVRKLVKEKIDEFQSSFAQLFEASGKSIIINAVNQEQAEELFLGLSDFFRANLNNTTAIHINLYDETLSFNAFDRFAETANYDEIKQWLELNKGKVREQADTIIDSMRTRLTYSKFSNSQTKKDGQAYAHLSFFRNNDKVDFANVSIDDMASGIACGGLLAGEASEQKSGSYFTGFGLKHIDYSNAPHLKLAKLMGSLIQPALKANTPYHGANAVALAVSDDFKELLERSYSSSMWTTIIDPKVTLDFFHSNEDVVLIHYSDQYTSSSSYDAITVTAKRRLFDKLIEQDDGGQINEFNAFNGDWLLKMMTCSPTINKERKGVIGAYKFVTSLVCKSDITWVPLSVAEMIRVSGNIGLKMSESDFSRNVNGYRQGAISDDVLLVGFRDQNLYILPVEVKTGARPDYNKAIKQAKELGRYLSEELLGESNLASKLYKGLFVRQVLMQVDKYNLYKVFSPNYFDLLLANKEFWLKGDYKLASIADYPQGFVVSHLDSASCLEPDYKMVDGILKIDLPMGLLPTLVKTPLQDMLNVIDISKTCHVPLEFILNPEQQDDSSFGAAPIKTVESLKTTPIQALPPKETHTNNVGYTPEKPATDVNKFDEEAQKINEQIEAVKAIIIATIKQNLASSGKPSMKGVRSQYELNGFDTRALSDFFEVNCDLTLSEFESETKSDCLMNNSFDTENPKENQETTGSGHDVEHVVDTSFETRALADGSIFKSRGIAPNVEPKVESKIDIKLDPVPKDLEELETKVVIEPVASGINLTVLFGSNATTQAPLNWEPTNTAKFMNTNTGIIGTMGTGKTQFTKSVLTQLYRNRADNVSGAQIGMLVFDYKSDYVDTQFQDATSGKNYNLHKLPYNPLSLFGDMPMLPVHTARGFSETMGKAFNLGQKQQLRLRKLVGEAYENAGINKANASTWTKPAPTIADVWALFIESEPDEDSLYAALESLNDLEIFEDNSANCQSLYELVSGVTVIELAGYPGEIQNLVVALTLDLFYTQMQKQGKPVVQGDYRQVTKMILVDEADNFMSQNFPSLRKILKEGREYGVGMILSTQDITHFQTSENDYSSYVLTWVVHRVAKIKNQDIKAIFGVNEKAEQDKLMESINKLEKHCSLYIDGAKKIQKMRDKAFWELLSDT
ncbi:DNA phosphorothioation-dependent restriction protein DptH [Agarivorans sp. MS3-6]